MVRLARAASHRALWGALALALGAIAGPGPASAQAPVLGTPTLDPSGVVRWVARRDSVPSWARTLVLPPVTRADSLALWQTAAAQPQLRSVACHRLGQLWLGVGDTARADSCWALAASDTTALAVPSPWAWPSLRERAGIALARGQPARGDSLLERADRARWPEAERAAWLALRVSLCAAAGETAQAVEFARQALRAYPAQGVTGQVLARLEEMLQARGDSLAPADERAAAEVDAFRGERASAARRLRRVLARAEHGERWSVGVRLSEVLRASRRLAEAHAAAQAAWAESPSRPVRGHAALERARIFRDAGQPESALVWYAAAAESEGQDVESAAAWEAGRTAEDDDRWGEALAWYARVARLPGRRASSAAFRAGLMHFVEGRLDSACTWWPGGGDEASRFWLGVALRARGETVAGDLALWSVAATPGYTFYSALARDTLGLRGWPGRVAAPDAAAPVRCPDLMAAAELAAIGDAEDASRILVRLGDAGMRSAACDSVAGPVSGAAIAYASGRPGLGISLALAAAEAAPDSLRWDLATWAFPPAYEALFVAPRDTVVATLEPALLFAVTRQESRFDPRARSRSDALGLMQLKLATAAEMAQLAREAAPTEAALFDPERNVRYGARYLRRLLRRFDGSVAAALSAYNAGPSTLPVHWRELLARGGEALLCELASNALAQDYAKRIIGYRAAYRELRPTAAP